MASENQVTKIYEIKTIGYDDVFAKIGNLTKQWESAKKAKQAYDQAETSRDNSRRLEEESKKVQQLEKQIKDLVATTERMRAANEALATSGAKGAATQVSEYAKLVAAYKAAEKTAREMAAAFGVDSEQAKEAAAAAQQFKNKLVDIGKLVKGSGIEQLTEDQIRNAEAMKKQAAESRILAREQITLGNTIEGLRAKLAVLTAKRNKLEIDSEEFKLTEKDIIAVNQQLSALEQRSGDFRRNVGNYKSGFDGVRNSINQLTREVPAFTNSIQTGFLALSNNLPIFFDEISRTRQEISRLRAQGEQVPGLFQRIAGALFSWGTALTIGITLLITYGKEIGSFVSALFKGTQALNAFAERQRIVNESLNDGSLTQSITDFKQLVLNIDLAKQGLLDKQEVLDQYNSTLGKATGEVKNLDEAEQNLVKNGDKYIEYLIKRVAAQKAAEKASQALLEAELIGRRSPTEFNTFADRAVATPIPEPGRRTPDQSEFQKKFLEDQGKARQKTQVESKKSIEKLYDGIAKEINTEAAGILSQLQGTRTKTTPGAGSKLDGSTQDSLKLIDAQIKRRIAIEQTGYNEILKVRAATFDEEVTFIRRLEAIEEDGLLKKIDLLSRKKKLNAEEQQTVAEYREQLSSLYLQSNEKVNQVEQRRVDFQEKLINQELETLKKAAADRRDLVLNDANATESEKAGAVLAFDQEVLNAQLETFKKLEALGLQFTVQSRERLRIAIDESRKALVADQKKVQLADVADLERDGRVQLLKIQTMFAERRKAILDNDKLTAAQKKKQLDELEKAENRTILSAEVEQLIKEVALKQVLLEDGVVSEEAYLNKVAELREKAAALSGSTTGEEKDKDPKSIAQLLQDGGRKLFGIDEGSLQDNLLGQVIANSFDVARQAMEGYFAAEETSIRNSLKVQLERLRIEEEQALNRAQTAQEEESLRKQFDAKKREEEKAAGERLKRLKIAEARIALATELANIAVAAAQNPLNGVTLGAAGVAMYGVLAGLALGRYALNVANINRTQFFEQGGQVPTKGGKFGGKSHSEGGTPFQFQGQSFEAEVGELAIVRTKGAPKGRTYSVTGTQEQIASMLNQIGGGKAFAPGARMTKFEFGGKLGENLQPPVFTPLASVTNAANQSDLLELAKGFETLAGNFEQVAREQAARLDRIQVIMNVKDVTRSQDKLVQQAQTGNL